MTPVERVARAIYRGKGSWSWERLPRSHQQPYLRDARAAITAIRDELSTPPSSIIGTPAGFAYMDAVKGMVDEALEEG